MGTNISKNGLTVLERRYLIKDESGNPMETPDELLRRVAKAVAAADKEYISPSQLKVVEEEFYNMMNNLEFLPNSPTLMNAGRPLGQLSACFVLPIKDSMTDIFETVKNAALIHKSGGGTGFSFSRLRANGASVNSTGGVASGPISFMKVFNAATEAVKQGGTRRGANMGILRIDHPDILDFITCKKDNKEITNFNISVGITEDFMRAVELGEEYNLLNPVDRSVIGSLSARKVFDLIVEMAWNNGEPGIVFLDRLNEYNPTPALGEIESTNPCGEQPLLPYEACNLGSINLKAMLKERDDVHAGECKYEVDYEKLAATVARSIHFLDNVIDVNKYPIPEIDMMTKSTRKVGLGVMGWADMLCLLEIPYNSEEALRLAEEIMSFIKENATEESVKIAKVKGVFPEWENSIFKDKDLRVRNATTTTIAPTGTLSIIADVSSGVEPLFAISYIRYVMDKDELLEVNPNFSALAKEQNFYSDELMRRIASKGSIHDFPEVPEDIQRVFVTSHDVEPDYHIRMQAAFQKCTDNAVSKTVNLPNHATKEDVERIYMLAHELDCKGVTIYRDGSRSEQVLNVGAVNKDEKGEKAGEVLANKDFSYRPDGTLSGIKPRPRPAITRGFTEKVKIGCGTIFITVNYDEDGICEIFANLGRAGGCPSQSEATSRLASIALRAGVDTKSIIDQLKGIRCHSTIRQKGLSVLSCPDAIGKVVEKVMKLQTKEFGNYENGDGKSPFDEDVCIKPNGFKREEGDVPADVGNIKEVAKEAPKAEPKLHEAKDSLDSMKFCPECGAKVAHEGGCVVCHDCGYSKCG